MHICICVLKDNAGTLMPDRRAQEEFQRRQKHALAMLQNSPADPLAALEQKYRTKMCLGLGP